jgi:glycogen operon protein
MGFEIAFGFPEPMGVSLDADGANFVLFSAHAEEVELCLFDDSGTNEVARLRLPKRTGDLWHGYVPGISAGRRYGYRVHGPYAPQEGHRFNPNKLLIDPYALALDRALVLDDVHFGYRRKESDLSFDARDSAPKTPKGIVTAFAKEDQGARRNTSWRDSIIYELHVRGMTMRREDIPLPMRGTLAALASPQILAHLRDLGITAVELMPIHPIGDEPRLIALGLRNYWGYNPLNYFAVEPRYANGDGAEEFRTFAAALHEAGIEVILDVVFNHTAEGDELGPTLSFRGIDNASYYMLAKDRRGYVNHSCCGNTLNVAHPKVRALVLDALGHWARLGADGFRFDLGASLGRDGDAWNTAGLIAEIAAHPELSGLKLIAEPWDIGPGGYKLGAFPAPYREWNDRYRDGIRRYWRGERGRAGDFATRLSGSSDVMGARGPLSSVNFVSAHDGFTLQDLVSYNAKKNWENGEGNADGTNENYSWNCGAEGPSEDSNIRALRYRQKRNFIVTLLLSQGVPMLHAGDELGHSQKGNNNAYCQDNETSWLDWRLKNAEDSVFLDFVRRIIALRRRDEAFRRETFFSGAASPNGRKDIAWFDVAGRELVASGWQDLSAFGCAFGDERFLLLANPAVDAVSFTLPTAEKGPWDVVVDTARESEVDVRVARGAECLVSPHSLMLLKESRA